MDSIRIPKYFGCSSHKNLTVKLLRLRSKSSSSSQSSSTTPKSPNISRRNSSREDEFREVFRHFDTDNDGKISAFELRAYFGSIGEHMSHEDAQEIIDELDTDGDSFIDFEDFKKMVVQKEGTSDDESLKAAFEMYEVEKGCGRITPKSLQRVLSRLGDPKSYDECVTMIQVYDTDGNGELDYHEFRQMMTP
ncbi:putative calcium-binding protein CML41 [Nicotiana tabacum]|uniref:Calcium-binding protein CML41 n=1 Tax=Nicotiana tabacum TaxID=4097 RepID=A0A1S4BZ83_TOBAC|nr:PREDICTED: probable calcium-binding protein CML41 [Nicotiana tabacum]